MKVVTDRHGKFFALLVALLAGFSFMPLVQPYFLASSDGLHHLYRLMEYDLAIRDGVWYPRWAPDFFYGLGMPTFNYYAPLSYYLAEVFRLLGAGYIDAIRILAAAAMVLAGLGAYLYGRTILSPAASLLVAIAYMYVPYHLVNLYYRFDIAEYLAYAWFPFILWALARLVERRRLTYLILAGILYSALILSHNVSAYTFSGFVLIYAAALLIRQHGLPLRRWKNAAHDVLRLAAVAALAAGLTSFFWAPALIEKSLVNIERLLRYDFHEHFPTLEQLLSTSFIHQYAIIHPISDTYPYKLGYLQSVFVVLGALVFVWQFRRARLAFRIEGIASLAVAALSFYLISPASMWIWENAPFINLTQFPWRFLSFVALPSALLAGMIAERLPGLGRLAVVAALTTLVIVSSTVGILPPFSDIGETDVSPRGSMEFELAAGTIGTTSEGEYVPKWVKELPATSSIALAAILDEESRPIWHPSRPGVEVSQTEKRADRMTFKVLAQRAGPLTLDIVFFPAWEAFVDGKQTDINVDKPSGLIVVEVPAGEHTIGLKLVKTPVQQAGEIASAVSFLVLLGMIALDLRRRGIPAVSIPKIRLDRTMALKAGAVLALFPIWLAGKSLYDSAYPPLKHYGYPLLLEMDKGIEIEGYDMRGVEPGVGASSHLAPGSTLEITLYWRAIQKEAMESYTAYARLTNRFDQTWAFAESTTESLQVDSGTGYLIASTLKLPVPPATPPGVYRLEFRLQSKTSGEFVEPQRVWMVPLFPYEKGPRARTIIVGKSPADANPVARLGSASSLPESINFEGNMHLLDFRLSDGEALRSGRPGAPLARQATGNLPEARAGETVHLDLLWQAAKDTREDYWITLRLVDANRMLWAVRDSLSADGLYPTSFWSMGEILRDQMNLRIPPETPPGQFELQLEVVSRKGPLAVLDSDGTPMGTTLRLDTLAVLPSSLPANSQQVEVQRRIDFPLLDGLYLIGYSLGREEIRPGESVDLDLVWRATKAIKGDLLTRVELVDRSGKPRAVDSKRPTGDAYPVSLWRPGEALRAKHRLTLDAAAPEGEIVPRIKLIDSRNGQALGQVDLPSLRVLPRSRLFDATPTRPLASVFDGKTRLLGYDVSGGEPIPVEKEPEVSTGEALKVRLYWQAISEMSTSYTVFAQILDPRGKLVSQHDSPPQNGDTPTTAWVAGEVVVDEHTVLIPHEAPAGSYTFIVGMYDASTGKRLLVEGGGDHVAITSLRVLQADKR